MAARKPHLGMASHDRFMAALPLTAAILQNQDLMRKIMRDFEAKTAEDMQRNICQQALRYVDVLAEQAGLT